jgi:caffeoyl-CoA O-methyltransferase
MGLIDEELQRYAEKYTTAENELLQVVNRDTHANVLKSQMLSGHLQGRLLAMISAMVVPKTILEIGTYTGYSALCLAEGLDPKGKIITIDVNDELEDRVRSFFTRSQFAYQIDYRLGDARTIIPLISESLDLVFIDADKQSYSLYFDLVIDKVRPGGIILADNVLRSGRVLHDKLDKDTQAIEDFNRKIHEDRRVENVLLPVRDGIMMIRKLSL